MGWKSVGLFLSVFFIAATAQADIANIKVSQIPITNFHGVSPGIYRGARPETIGMNALAQAGIRTVLDLEKDDEEIRAEKQDADRLNLHFISMPMSGFWAPSDGEVNDILFTLADPSNYPIFVHCKHGEDRTGLIVGLYRVFFEGKDPVLTHDEMKFLGFHDSLIFLHHYYNERTGL